MKAKLKYKENGECVSCCIDTKEDGFLEEEVDSLDINQNHKEPFRSEYRFSLIKENTKDLLRKYNYIFGLESGWNQDDEFKSWFESLINFQNSFEGQTITESEITFPTDPRGDTVTLKF